MTGSPCHRCGCRRWSLSLAPETMGQDVASCFIPKGGGAMGCSCSVGGSVGGIGCTGLCAIAIEDGRFGHNAQVGECNAAKVHQLIVHIIVADAD